MTPLALGSFLTFGALLVLYGANSTELIAALDLDYEDLGLLGSMLSLGLGVGIIGAGPLINRFPRRPLFIASCLLVIGATTTLGPHTTFRALLVQTILIGFGAGFYETVLNALAIEEFGERAPRRLVFIHSGATFAATVTPLVFAAMRSAYGIDWYHTFQIVGSAHLALIAGVCFVPMRHASARVPASSDDAIARDSSHEGDREEERGEERNGERQDDWTGLAAICVAAFAYVGVETALTIFVADHATKDLGLDAARAARTISAFWGGLLIGRLAVGFAPRAPGAGTTALLAAFAAAFVLAFGSGVLATPELAMAATGFFLGGVFPVMIGLAGMALPSSAGTAVGLAGGLGSLGGFVVPWFTGHVAGAGGLPFALSTLSGWLLLLVGAALIARFRQSR